MPFARVTVLPEQSSSLIQHLTEDLTALIAHDLNKRHELTSVLIETPQMARWTVGAAGREVAAHLEVCVTLGTNTEAEKQAFIRKAMVLLRQTLPQLSTATYVVVKEVPAANWGYDGETQAARALSAL